MITRKLSKLRAHAATLPDPASYLADALGDGVVVDEAAGTYTMSEERWVELRHKYRATGAGDIVARGAAWLGIKPCGGCKKRQAKLNRVIPFK